MPFASQSTNNTDQLAAAQQAADIPVEVPQAEAEAIADASPNFELTSLPARTGGGGVGRRGPRHVTEEMVNAIVQSEDPDAAIVTPYKAVTGNLQAWAKERTLRFTSRGGKVYLTKLPAQENTTAPATTDQA